MGGAGYRRGYPAEQAARDCKILSIWEGTNHMQSLFLLRDKLGLCLRPSKLATLQAHIERTLAHVEELGGWSREIAATRRSPAAAQSPESRRVRLRAG